MKCFMEAIGDKVISFWEYWIDALAGNHRARVGTLTVALVLFICVVTAAAITADSAKGGVRSDAYSVRDDAYGVAGVWRSYADYLERTLWVPGLDAPSCTSGVIYLGDELYRVPAGVSQFRCHV